MLGKKRQVQDAKYGLQIAIIFDKVFQAQIVLKGHILPLLISYANSMLKPISKLARPGPNLSRWFRASATEFQALKQKAAPEGGSRRHQPTLQPRQEQDQKELSQKEKDALVRRYSQFISAANTR